MHIIRTTLMQSKQNIVLHSLKITADTAKESGQASH